jgi:hypothetical protein
MSFAIIWGPGAIFLAAVLALLIVPGFALIALTVVLIAAVAAILALAAAIVATPYLLLRRWRSRPAIHPRPPISHSPVPLSLPEPAVAPSSHDRQQQHHHSPR